MMTTKRFRGARWTNNEDAGDLGAQHEADASAAREEDRRGRVEGPAPKANQYAGWCAKCGARVEAGAGWIVRELGSDRWFVRCAVECPKALERPAAPTSSATPNKFGGACCKCSAWVEAGAGLLAGRGADGRYKVAHAGECPSPEPKAAELPEVPEGRYAIGADATEADGGPLKFYKVDRPTAGKWAGRVFVSVQASDEFHAIKNPNTVRAILAAIAFVGAKAAAIRYGRELGRCSCCGRTLTNEKSRAAGIGPECAEKFGW